MDLNKNDIASHSVLSLLLKLKTQYLPSWVCVTGCLRLYTDRMFAKWLAVSGSSDLFWRKAYIHTFLHTYKDFF